MTLRCLFSTLLLACSPEQPAPQSQGLAWSLPASTLLLDQAGFAVPELGRVAFIGQREAAWIITHQFKRLTGREIEPHELELIQVTAWIESQYGMGWLSGAGSNNWGAITAACGPDAFRSMDHDRLGKPYQSCFAIYASPSAGARALVGWFARRPEILAAACPEDALALMHDAHFFAGRGGTREERIEARLQDYYVALRMVKGD